MSIISLKNISLQYPLLGGASNSLRTVMGSFFVKNKKEAVRVNFIEALSKINLDLKEGTRLGLLGSNGAGKSSLLRVMAGIYVPTEGTMIRKGKTVTMFDLYCGMDEEANGLENIWIAGLTLGLSVPEIRKRIPDVKNFSELGDSLQRPVKTYSAGMRLRLIFSLTSSLHSDILLVDELIGVGDIKFLKKASDRLKEQSSKTKVFVLASHSEWALRDFCTTGLVMSSGKIAFYGDIQEAITFYNREMGQ
ncbi:MAG: ABC transporter ATP-binding protein [Rickettsia endosymbiont of Bryobia graminum]|nr:ABC transporter ATP-binding protein [Rickettsia endosymbiont of Bryobia graminum]